MLQSNYQRCLVAAPNSDDKGVLAMRRPVEFRLSLCANCLKQLNEAACRSINDMEKERAAMAAGREIAGGSNAVAPLERIANWKSARRRALLWANEEHELQIALDVARGEASANEKIEALAKLKGVGVPMASAILTAINPEQYTVLDVRALDALGARGKINRRGIYSYYLNFCFEQAAACEMTLRDFDRALWKAGAAQRRCILSLSEIGREQLRSPCFVGFVERYGLDD